MLCVLGLLAGLLGMHGLAPGGGLPERTHAQPTQAQPTHVLQPQVAQAPAVQHHAAAHTHPQVMPYGHCGDGHVQHADATCASGAVGGGPVLPLLVADPVPVSVRQDAVRAYAVVDPDGARAPPSLSELQLLRI
ncbi:hypothetical protein GCM10010383_07800 [Streptomyces lomondensis]|uniref:Secreted protein n=1 Tax=Streptomyces lomondensis TaxID=68229 RepID=A0ABQ2WWB8_9ACTN|nr:hypothetical protein GCM10010383_07800 [Streptomyces lomondensis]